MPPFQIYGTRINVEQTGSGPPLVLIHGLGDESDSWLPALNLLSASFTVVRYDLRGHGLSGGELPVDQGSLVALVADLDRILDHRGMGSVHLAGHDLGGAVAQRLAYEQPERVRSLILEGTLPAPLDPPVATLAALDETDADAGDALATADSRRDSMERLGAIRCPTLVLVGEEDAWPFQDGAELLHGWIPNSRLVRVPDAGHTPHREQPEAFTALVQSFLAEHG